MCFPEEYITISSRFELRKQNVGIKIFFKITIKPCLGFLCLCALSIMTSNSPPGEQNKLSVYHINTASYSRAAFNIPACPCAAWRRRSPRCREEQGSNHTLPERRSLLGRAHSRNTTREEGTQSVPDDHSVTRFSILAGRCPGNQRIRRQRKKSPPLFTFCWDFPTQKLRLGHKVQLLLTGTQFVVLLNSFVGFFGLHIL